jgi:hypothetical protein
MKKEFNDIIDKNIGRWSRLNKWLGEERLGKRFIKERSRRK